MRLFSSNAGGFFDLGAIHLLTTASLKRLGEIYPEGRFDPRRFRPNIVLEIDSGEAGLVEDEWLGETLHIGDEVRLRVTEAVARCVMVTLPQADLPKDQKIMSTTYRYNGNRVGDYVRCCESTRFAGETASCSCKAVCERSVFAAISSQLFVNADSTFREEA